MERSSADRMRGLEKTQGEQWVTTKNKRSDIPFVRTASSGLWKDKLPAESIAEIEAAWGPLMSTLGYELTSPHASTRYGNQSSSRNNGSADSPYA